MPLNNSQNSTNNILGQNTRNPRFFANNAAPDTDNRMIDLTSQGFSVIPDLMWDHTQMQYIIPPGAVSNITISNFRNGQERTLHTLMLSNAYTTNARTFIFGNRYVFLDDPGQNKIVDPGKILAYFGTIVKGKMYLRLSIESTT
jgi:hypothetical protein